MPNPLIPAVVSWAEACVGAGVEFAQEDIDWFVPAPPSRAAQAMLRCAEAMSDVMRRHVTDLVVAAVVPLPSGHETLPSAVPSWDDLLGQDWNYDPGREVPGLYLTRPTGWTTVTDGEEYVRRADHAAIPDGFVG